MIDLHVHSSSSDGTLPPALLTEKALQCGLTAYALTDHDTVAGVGEAKKAALGTSLEVISGAELSCTWEGAEIHILGLYLDESSQLLDNVLTRFRLRRAARNEEMLSRFNRDGYSLSMEDLSQGRPGSVITRAHFARALLEKGYVSSMEQAFKRYLEQGGPYCPPKENFKPEEAISLIRTAGGFASLAHPVLYKLGWKKTELLISCLKALGLGGVEVYYSSHQRSDTQKLQEICRAHSLLPTGGSDFHGANKPDIRLGTGRGGLRVPDPLLEDIRRVLHRQL